MNHPVSITSRQEIDGFSCVNIKSPSPEYCKTMYIKEIWKYIKDTYSNVDDTYINKITELANYHTQTIMLIARAHIPLDLSFKEMFEELNKTGFTLKGNDEVINADDYKLTMAEHLTKIFNLLNVTDQTQLRTIRLFSLLSPNIPIRKRDIKKWFGLKSFSSINELVKYGWLNRSVSESGSEYISIHPVIADVIKYNYEPDYEFAMPLIDSLQQELETADTYEKRNNVIVHAAAVAEAFQESESEKIATTLSDLGFIYYANGSYNEALDYSKKALSIFKKIFGLEHPIIATIYNGIGQMLTAQGNFQEALENYNTASAIQQKFSEKEPTYSALTYNSIGQLLATQGDYQNALDFFNEAFSIQEKNLGIDPVEPMISVLTYNNIGQALAAQGDYKKALEQYNKALSLSSNLVSFLGVDNTLASVLYNSIGTIYSNLSEYEKALEYYNKALLILQICMSLKYHQ